MSLRHRLTRIERLARKYQRVRCPTCGGDERQKPELQLFGATALARCEACGLPVSGEGKPIYRRAAGYPKAVANVDIERG